MKFVHAADLHLGSLRGVKTVSQEAKLTRYAAALIRVFEIAREQGAEAVVIAGDVFDHKNIKPKVRDLFLRTLLDYSDLQVLIINGNHDVLEDDYTSLHFLSLLQNRQRLPHVTLAEVTPRTTMVAGCLFILVPFVGDSKVFRKRVKHLVKTACASSAVKKSTPVVVVAHEMIANSKDDAGWQAKRSGFKLPKLKRVTYWALGDIHRRQSIEGMRNAWYAGPPMQCNFKESPDKGVLLVDTRRPTRPTFIPIEHPDVAPLLNVEADTVEEVKERLSDAAEGAWVNLRCPGDVRAQLNPEDTADAEVVKSVPSPRQQKEAAEQATQRIAVSISDPLRSLPDYLIARMGYNKKQAREATQVAREL